MNYNLVLVHSPFVGPTSWRLVGDELAREGHRIVVPSLLPALGGLKDFDRAIARCVKDSLRRAAVPDPIVLVGHSAAGAYLPAIEAELHREVSACVFVDARLPVPGASLATQDTREEVEQIRGMAREGMLPPWSNWFGEGTMREVIPDEKVREHFVAELLPIPLALYEEEIRCPSSWPEVPCAYLRLSEYYKPVADEARARGWVVTELEAQHMLLLTNPRQVAGTLLGVVDELMDQ